MQVRKSVKSLVMQTSSPPTENIRRSSHQGFTESVPVSIDQSVSNRKWSEYADLLQSAMEREQARKSLVEKLRLEKRNVEKDFLRSRSQYTLFTEDLERAINARLKTSKQELDTLRNASEGLKSENSKLRDEIDSLLKRCDIIQVESGLRTQKALEAMQSKFEQDLARISQDLDTFKRRALETETLSQKIDEKQSLLAIKEGFIQDLSDQIEGLRAKLAFESNEVAKVRKENEKAIIEKAGAQEDLDQARTDLEEKDRIIVYITDEIEKIKNEFKQQINQQEASLTVEHAASVSILKGQLKEAVEALTALERELDSGIRENALLKDRLSILENEKENINNQSERRLQKLTAIVTTLSDKDL